jgi:hypothetical protein
VGERTDDSKQLQTSPQIFQVFLGSVKVTEVQRTDAYSNLGLNFEKYIINMLSRVENENMLTIRIKRLVDREKI